MSDYVNVYLRVRPSIRAQNIENELIDREISTERMVVVDSMPFQFDRIFYQEDSQADVFKHMVEKKVEKVVNGFNCLIFAYGQSGAGKTHTIGLKQYAPGANLESEGIIIRSIDTLFQKLAEKPDDKSTVSVSFVEIYKEKVYDLLTETRDKPIYQKGTHYHGSFKKVIENSDEARDVILIGNRNRHTRGTLLNETSSRSHALFTIEIRNESTTSIMNICDLAGSEGLRTTNHLGTPQKEGVEINKGLLALKRAIQELSNRKKVTSHRESVLTMILQSSLNLKSYFAIIGCITSNRDDRTETQSTIRFLQEIKKLDAKAVPELNAFREKQRSNQTPMRPYMQQYSRNSSILNRTTPSKQNPNTSRIIQQNSLLRKQPTMIGSISSRYQTPSAQKKLRLTNVATTSTVSKPSKMTTNINETNHILENTFNISNCSASTEIDHLHGGASAQTSAQKMPTMARESTNLSFNSYDRRIKALEDQLKVYQQALLSVTNFNQFQQTMMMSMTNNESTQQSDLNFTFDIPEDGLENWQWMNKNFNQAPKSSIIPPAKPSMNFSRLETTQFNGQNRDRAIENEDQPQRENRKVFAHLNNLNENSVEEVVPIIGRKSSRIAKKQVVDELKKQSEIEYQKSLDFFEVLSSFDKVSKSQYKKNILKIFNEGDINDLSKIPLIGKKTASQVMLLRNRKPFKDINDLKNIYSLSSDKVWNKLLKSLFLD